jgi:hypothetical protein
VGYATTVTCSSNGTFTPPSAVTLALVEAWGGGGGGGAARGNPAKGGGGAGGQYASKGASVAVGTTYSITVGAGGTGGTTAAGGSGGDSTFGGSTVVAKGGQGGGGATTDGGDGTAGAGSTTSGVGTTVYRGGNGVAGSAGGSCNTSGAGGGGAGSGGAGGDAAGNTGGTGTATGGGAGGNASNGSNAGGAGSVRGGGGGGACAESNGDQTGGAGAAGRVVLTYSTGLPAPTAIFTLDDQTWNDSSGNGYNGAVGGLTAGTAPTFDSTTPAVGTTTGTCGYRAFNRPDKTYIYLPTAFPNLGASGQAFTITAWIRTTDNTQSGQRILIDDENDSSGYGFSLGDAGTGMVRFFTRGASSALILDTPNVVANNTWYFVAAVADVPTKTKHIYVFSAAGALLSHVSATWTESSFGSDSGVVSIGGETNASGENNGSFGFAGNIDEVRVYPAALAQINLADVLAITRTCPTVVAPYKFNACDVTSPKCVPTILPSVTYATLADKAVGQSFNLDLVALLSGGTLNSSFNGTAQIDLVANTSAGVALGAKNCPVSQTATIALGNKTFASGRVSAAVPSQGTSYADVRVKFTCSAAQCGTTTTECSTDNFAIAISGPDHVEIVHDGQGGVCSGDTVTLKACADAACSSLYTGGGVSVSLTPATGWTSNPVTIGTSGTASATYTTDLAGTTRYAITSHTFLCDNTSTATASNATTECDVAFANNEFVIAATDSLGNIPVAGRPHRMTLTAYRQQAGQCGIATNYRNNKTLKAWYSNGAGVTPSPLPTLSLSADCSGAIPASGLPATEPGSTNVTLNFTNGVVDPLYLCTGDVGKFSLVFKDASPTILTATSPTLTVRPYGFKMTGLTCSAPFTGAAGFCPGGESFTGTVTAVRYDSTATNNLGAATPSFGKEVPPQTVSFAASSMVTPSDGTVASLSSSVGAFNGSGVATGTFSWPEVGSFNVQPSVNYLGVGDLISAGKTDSETAAGAIGRFHPYRYVIANNGSVEGYATCDLTYAGQPFQLGITLTPKLKDGITTPVNFGKSEYTWRPTGAAFSIVAENNNLGTNLGGNIKTYPGAAIPSFAPTWSGSVATLAAANYAYGRSALFPPLDALKIGIAFADNSGDKVPAAGNDMNPGTTGACLLSTDSGYPCTAQSLIDTRVRYGRLRLINAYGSELLQSRVEYRTEYWDGNHWLTNTVDTSCSGIAPANVATGGLTIAGSPSFSNGAGFITFNTEAAGSYDIAINLGATGTANVHSCNATNPPTTAANMPWLQGYWSSNCNTTPAWAQDPNARIKLGSPKAPYIFLRERY